MTYNKESYFEQKINKKESANVADLSEDDQSYVVNVLEISSMEEKINHLKEIQENFDNLQKEKADFEAKYQKLSQAYCTTRYKIVNGVAEVEGVTNETTAEAEENGVPLFWLNTMKNNKDLAEEIMECDKDALKYLEDIECTTIDDPEGFVLKFSFKSNPYFFNSYLEKTFHMGRYAPIKAIGTQIGWFNEKCLTLDKEYNPQKSFFNIFEDIDNGDEEESDEYMIWELQLQIERHYDIAEMIKNMIIPHAVSWYTNAAQGEEIGVVDSSDENDEEKETETKEGEEIGVVDSSDEKDEGEEETKTKEQIIATSFCDKTYEGDPVSVAPFHHLRSGARDNPRVSPVTVEAIKEKEKIASRGPSTSRAPSNMSSERKATQSQEKASALHQLMGYSSPNQVIRGAPC